MTLEDKFKILVVDDKQENLDAAIRGLNKYANEIVIAKNYVDAIDVAKKERPDIGVIDLMFPYNSASSEIKKMGYKLQGKLNEMHIINIILTSGVVNHDQGACEIIPSRKIIPIGNLSINPIIGDKINRVTPPGSSKTNPETWEFAYRHIFEEPSSGLLCYLKAAQLYKTTFK